MWRKCKDNKLAPFKVNIENIVPTVDGIPGGHREEISVGQKLHKRTNTTQGAFESQPITFETEPEILENQTVIQASNIIGEW